MFNVKSEDPSADKDFGTPMPNLVQVDHQLPFQHGEHQYDTTSGGELTVRGAEVSRRSAFKSVRGMVRPLVGYREQPAHSGLIANEHNGYVGANNLPQIPMLRKADGLNTEGRYPAPFPLLFDCVCSPETQRVPFIIIQRSSLDLAISCPIEA
jgi:hypothetical protein